jgi:hypothetical protein
MYKLKVADNCYKTIKRKFKMTKNNSNKPQQDKSYQRNKSENKVTFIDESVKGSVFIGNKSKSETITSHFDSPPSPIDKKTKKKK